MKFRKIISFILLFALFLSGCGKKAEITEAEARPASVSDSGQWLGNGGCYRLETIGEGSNMNNARRCESNIIIRGLDLRDKDGNIIFPEYPLAYCPAEDGVWICKELGWIDGEFNSNTYLAKLSLSGEELFRTELPHRADYMEFSADGKLYTNSFVDEQVHVYSDELEYLGALELDGAYPYYPIKDGSGRIWLFAAGDKGEFVALADSENMCLGKEYSMPAEFTGIYTGDKHHDFIYTTARGLYRWNVESDEHEQVLIWDECYIPADSISSIMPDGDGYLCLSGSFLARISPADPAEIKPRTKLTIGSMLSSSSLIADFNAQSDKYYVEQVEYCQGYTLADRENAITKLNTELISGNGPDMLFWYEENYGARGFVMDLYPFIDEDPNLSRDDFYTLKAAESKGKLYYAYPSFVIHSNFAFEDTVGDRTGWSWDEFFAIAETLPDGGSMMAYMDAENFLYESLCRYSSHAVDWESASCNFDSPDFIRILEAALAIYDPNLSEENTFFIDEVYTMMAEGKVIADVQLIHSLADFARPYNTFGREISHVGWPTPDGSCGSSLRTDSICINSSTDCPEGCWEFIKYAITHGDGSFLPVYKPLLDKQIIEAQRGDAPVLTPSQAEDFLHLVDSINTVHKTDEALWSIVQSESRAMFAGDKSPAEVARNIQSKASIYVAEQA